MEYERAAAIPIPIPIPTPMENRAGVISTCPPRLAARRNAAADRPALGDSGSGAVAAPVPGAKTDPLLGRLAQPQLQRETHEVHESSVVPSANDPPAVLGGGIGIV